MKFNQLVGQLRFVREQHVRVALLIGTLVLLATGCASPAGFDG